MSYVQVFFNRKIGTLIERPLCSKLCDALKNDDYSHVVSMWYSTASFQSIRSTSMNLSSERNILDQIIVIKNTCMLDILKSKYVIRTKKQTKQAYLDFV